MNDKIASTFLPIICAIFFGFFTETTTATVYYLDATNGDDSWNGTKMDYQSGMQGPWKSLTHLAAFSANSGFLPGDQILFKRGEVFTTLSSIYITSSGEAESYIEFGAYGNPASEKPILRIQMRKLSVSAINKWFWKDQGNGVWLYTYPGSVIGGIWNDDVHLKQASDRTLADGDFYWDNEIEPEEDGIPEEDKKGIYYRPDDDNPLDDNIYRGLQGFGFDIRGVSYVRVRDLHFRTGYRPLTGGSSATASLHHVIIEDCEFDNTRTGILFGSGVTVGLDREIHDITIQNNAFTSNGRSIIITSSNGAATSTSIMIKNNLIIDTDANHNFEDFQASQGGNLDIEAISIQNANNSSIIDNEISIGASDTAIIIWTNSQSTSNDNIIARNVIHDITGAGIGLFGTNTPNANLRNLVHHNLIYNCTDKGAIRLSAKGDDYSNSIYNNTIVNCGNSFYINGQASGFYIFNNISLNPTGHHVQYNHTVFASVMNNNIYYPDSASSFLLSNNTNKTLAEWQTDTGQDVNSVVVDPFLANIHADDFHLTVLSSAAIDTGIFSDQTEDIEKNPILGTLLPDIGAYEFGHNDSDGDGVIDYDEICYDGDCQNYNPYDSATNPSGGDLNLLNTDTDGDGYSDSAEISAGSNPISAASIPTVSAPAMGFTTLLLLLLGLAGIGLRFNKITFR